MNSEYYNALQSKYAEKNLKPQDLPPPCKGVPLTAKEYDYKTFYCEKFNEENKNGIAV